MDINNFGPFASDVWGTFSDWILIFTSVATIFFLWITFSAQRITNKEQASVNDIDFTLRLIDQLTNDLERFHVTQRVSGASTRFTGTKALIKYSSSMKNLEANHAFQIFDNSGEGDEMIYLYKSFDIIYNKIINSKITNSEKSVLMEKINQFFNLKLKSSSETLAIHFFQIPHPNSIFLVDFFNRLSDAKIIDGKLVTGEEDVQII